MNPSSNSRPGSQEVVAIASHRDDWRLERLIDRLPRRLGAAVRFLLRPSGFWLRIPAGLLLIVGGVLAFLPILGIWMLPLGLALWAEDIPLLRSLRSRVLDWIERRHPLWLEPRSRSDVA